MMEPADFDAPLLRVASDGAAIAVAPVDEDAAARLPADHMMRSLEHFTLVSTGPVYRTLTHAERGETAEAMRQPADYLVRKIDWPIVFREADQRIPAVWQGLARRIAAAERWSLMDLKRAMRSAALHALETAEMVPHDREELIASMHWSL